MHGRIEFADPGFDIVPRRPRRHAFCLLLKPGGPGCHLVFEGMRHAPPSYGSNCIHIGKSCANAPRLHPAMAGCLETYHLIEYGSGAAHKLALALDA